jgi:SAM-dependent methyltransferase
MQGYGRAFARVYNKRWAFFAQRVAPAIRTFYESTPGGAQDRTLLDVCCGTGQLAVHFAAHGYRLTGIDLSAHMLRHARENAAPYVASGAARFLQADAASFTVDGQFGLVVSTFDSLNHLPNQDALRGCFASVYPLLRANGVFIFDLNTRAGLYLWNGINVRDMRDALIVDRGVYDEESDRAWVRITGFVRTEGELYERFEQTAYNTAFDMAWVRQALLDAGWQSVHFARVEDLGTAIPAPEDQDRTFVVARK